MSDSEAKLNEIKEQFFNDFKTNIENGEFHEKDLARLRDNNDWLKAFYRTSGKNVEKTLAKLKDVLTWRKEFEANDLLTPGKLPFSESHLIKGGIFQKNTDVNNLPLLHFVVKKHKKGEHTLADDCKFIAYMLEKHYSFSYDKPLVIVFDMTDGGFSNTDMEMTRFLVTCLQTYYPGILSYLLAFQMPFLFNAIWKIIKGWLPAESVERIKFVDKKTIKEYIHEDQLFVHMGGNDTYTYSYSRS